MKVLKLVEPAHPCLDALWTFYRTNNRSFQAGTQVECDCGKQYELVIDERNELTWLPAAIFLPVAIEG